MQFAASFLGRATSRPTVHSVAALKRVARHLLKHPSMQFEYWLTPISEASVLEGCSDSDWAGCLTTSGSMSGGVVTLAGCAVKSWSNRQDSVALSSGEAEYYACVKAAAELMGLRSLATDLVWNVGLLEKCDTLRSDVRGRHHQASWSEDDLLISGRASAFSCKLTSLHVWWISCAGVCCGKPSYPHACSVRCLHVKTQGTLSRSELTLHVRRCQCAYHRRVQMQSPTAQARR